MKLKFGIVLALLAALVAGANVGGVGDAEAQLGTTGVGGGGFGGGGGGGTVVFSQALTQVSSPSNLNERWVIASSRLTACSGCMTARVKFTFASGGNGGPYTMGTVWIGQSNATAPNYNGDQVQLKFGGNATFPSCTPCTVTSDYVTLAQAFDATKSYTVSFHVPNVGGNLAAEADFLTNVAVWTDSSATDDSGNTTVTGYTSGNFGALIVEIDAQ
jgi:hypothetical protein